MRKRLLTYLATGFLAFAPVFTGVAAGVATSEATMITAYAVEGERDDDEDKEDEDSRYDAGWMLETVDNEDGALGKLNETVKDGGRAVNMIVMTMGIIVSVIGVAILGFRLILGSSMEKSNAKTDAFWIVGGILLIFGATAIVSQLAGVAQNLFK